MVKKRGQNKQIACTCEVCGKTFYASRKSTVCVDKSTCRVIKHQRKVEQTKIAKSFMLDMDTYQAYLKLMERYPTLKEKVDAMIFDMGNEKAAMVIGLIWETMCLESNRRYTALPD